MKIFQLIYISFSLLLASCNGTKSPERKTNDKAQPVLQLIRITEPINGSLYPLGEVVELKLKLVIDSVKPDSIVLFADNIRFGKIDGLNYKLNTENLLLGSRLIRATAWLNGNRQTASISLRLKANKAPKQLKYRVIKSYPHDIDAYTQGLFFHNGYLIESTGQKGYSSLRRVDLETGKILQSVNLDSEFFGEGATYYKGEIYQITWTSRKGFVYNPETFAVNRTFSYLTQGWGLTTVDDKLVMSDGSNVLYFLVPETFSEIKKIEVYNDKGPVNQLNELEYINGKIYANIYQTDNIVIINPQTGMVEAEVNFANILHPSDRHRNIDVFNGIAWDQKNNRLFVTGKHWPKVYQVEIY